ncbi:hypothetical protein AGMMS49975_29570 [Clostridia bacterium]|nr:hypothetical protein AGMMS49975_29570 [Clostridia bacterium]
MEIENIDKFINMYLSLDKEGKSAVFGMVTMATFIQQKENNRDRKSTA